MPFDYNKMSCWNCKTKHPLNGQCPWRFCVFCWFQLEPFDFHSCDRQWVKELWHFPTVGDYRRYFRDLIWQGLSWDQIRIHFENFRAEYDALHVLEYDESVQQGPVPSNADVPESSAVVEEVLEQPSLGRNANAADHSLSSGQEPVHSNDQIIVSGGKENADSAIVIRSSVGVYTIVEESLAKSSTGLSENGANDTPSSQQDPVHFIAAADGIIIVNNKVLDIFPPEIEFAFHHDSFAVAVYANEQKKLLENHFNNEWTPLYLSMAANTVEIGETAKKHYATFPKHVIYDVLQIVGKPLNEIRINPKWGFEMIAKDEIVYFQSETFSGPRLFPQELVVAAFFKVMKLRTEANLDTKIKDIRVSTPFKLNKCQMDIFEKAAAKNNLQIFSFVVNDA